MIRAFFLFSGLFFCFSLVIRRFSNDRLVRPLPLHYFCFSINQFIDVTEQISSERCYSFISQPYKEAVLSFRVGGIVDEFNVQSGQFFKQGSRIASIDERDFIIQKDHAQALYEQATSEYNRVKILYTQNNISGSTYEKAKADYQITKANLETATNQWKDTQLTAPFDGYVQQVYIEKYQDVRPSQAIVSLMDLSKIKIEVYIPEEIAVQLRTEKDLPIQITFDGLPGEIFTPTEIFVSQNITTNNISFLLTAIIMNPGNRLFGGMSDSFSVSWERGRETLYFCSSVGCMPSKRNWIFCLGCFS